MATIETLQLDSIIASRRALLVGGGAALAALALPSAANAAATVTGLTDADILNFALNLEYLEANYYYLAAFGTEISVASSSSTAAGAGVLGITGTGTQGVVIQKGGTKVPFALPLVQSYAIETAVEEGKHVTFLRTALGAAAVAQPQIDLKGAFDTLATAAGIGSSFDPFASDANFLIGAYVFEDVGVSAYKGAAPAIVDKGNLLAALKIHAVEAYHAGLVRSTINLLDPADAAGYITLTQKISALRATLSKAVATTIPFPASAAFGVDVPLTKGTQTVALGGGTGSATATTIVDADLTNILSFARTTNQVLNIVTGGNAGPAGPPAKGVFFPNGLNGKIV